MMLCSNRIHYLLPMDGWHLKKLKEVCSMSPKMTPKVPSKVPTKVVRMTKKGDPDKAGHKVKS